MELIQGLLALVMMNRLRLLLEGLILMMLMEKLIGKRTLEKILMVLFLLRL